MKSTPAALSAVLIPLFIILDIIIMILIMYAVRGRRLSARRDRPDPAALERYLRDPDLCSLSYAIRLLNLQGLAQDQRAAAVDKVFQAGADVLFIGQADARFGRPITQAVALRGRFVCSNCRSALSFDHPLGQVEPYRLSVEKIQGGYALAMSRRPALRLSAIGCRKDRIGSLAAELQYSCGTAGAVLINVEACTQSQARQLAAFFNDL